MKKETGQGRSRDGDVPFFVKSGEGRREKGEEAWLFFLLLPSFFFLALSARAEVPLPERFSLFDREVLLQADGSRGPYRISDRAMEQDSEQVWVAGVRQVRDVDYAVDAARARVTFYHVLPRGVAIVVRFVQAPQVAQPVYRRREAQAEMQEVGIDYRPVRTGPVEDAPALEVGGSKRLAVTFGSDRAHFVNQALQVRVSGDVAEGVSVLAMLSDHHLPVGEGSSTRALRELDQVLFQVASGGFSAELGDLDVGFEESTFARYRRQLQGARVSLSQNGGGAMAVGAVSRGQWTSQRIAPIEGYQGPYRLPGGSGLLGRMAPESERVYVNGRLLQRGDRLDYVVDYERGTVVFAPELPILAESRISVDYQVVADGVQSRLLGAQGQVARDDERMRVGAVLIRESDRAILPEAGGAAVHRQVATVYAAFAPTPEVQISGEAALSDRETGRGQAYRVDGQWAKGPVRAFGRFRQVGASFEGFERLDVGRAEGRWGWQPVQSGVRDREGEVGLRFSPGEEWAIEGGFGRRGGVLSAHRRSLVAQAPFGAYDYTSIGQDAGGVTRQGGRLSYALGPVRPGFQVQMENAHGDGVRGASVFYASGAAVLPNRVDVRDVVWDVEAGRTGRWEWRSELRHRRIGIDRQDSLRAWAQMHRVALSHWHRWSLSGAYTRSVAHTGSLLPARQVTHLGRGQVRYARPGYAHQVSYRISSTGIQHLRPIFVFVGRGLGSYVWEDVNGDGVQDAAEFVPDVAGDIEVVYADEGGFQPARDGALSARIEVDFQRLMDRGGWWSQVAMDVSLTADRQAASAMPWQLVGFAADSTVLGGQRDVWARVYLFRHHPRGSLQISGRWRDRLNRAFFSSGVEAQAEGGLLGRWRVNRQVDVEAEGNGGTRRRDDAGAFAYDIVQWTGGMRLLWRPAPGWQAQLGGTGGVDRDRVRDVQATHVSMASELIRSLPGRGRIRVGLDWTGVAADAPLPLFLGMAKGNRAGQNYIWRWGMDYRFGRYVTALASYDGRKRPDGPAIHLGRVEVRATF